MKKIVTLCTMLFLLTTIFAVTANPSLDGRAMVADRGVFPSGFYGKAPGYLPGDTVVVTNHSTGFAIDVMILSTSDASEGIAIVLSPEAAEKLHIKGKDVYVKIQKKQSSPYEKIITTNEKDLENNFNDDPDKNPEKVLDNSPELIAFAQEARKDFQVEQDGILPQVIEIPPEEDITDSELVEDTKSQTSSKETVLLNESIKVIDEPEIEVVELPFIDEQKVTESTEPLVSTQIPIEEELITILEETKPVTPPSPMDTTMNEETEPVEEFAMEVVSEPVEEIELKDILEPTEEVVLEVVTEPVEEIKLQEILEPTEEIALEIITEPVEEIVLQETLEPTEEIAFEEIEETVEIALEEIEEPSELVIEETEEPEELVIEEIEEPVEVASVEPRNIFEEIVNDLGEEIPELLPSEDNPPLATNIENTEIEEVLIINPVPLEPVHLEPTKNDVGIVKYSNFLKNSELLEKNKYYIQIATMKEVESIDLVISKYASKYPVNLIEVDNKYQVLLGPFTDDEYVAVYERFRQKEFSDAFVKKIK